MAKKNKLSITIEKNNYLDMIDRIWKSMNYERITTQEGYWDLLTSKDPSERKRVYTLSEMVDKLIYFSTQEVVKEERAQKQLSDSLIANKELVLSNQELRAIKNKLTKENEEIKKDIEAKVASHIKKLITKDFDPTIEADEEEEQHWKWKLRNLYGVGKTLKEIWDRRINDKLQYEEFILLKGKNWHSNFTDRTSTWDTFEATIEWDLDRDLLKIATLDEVDIYIRDYSASKNCLKKDIPELKL